MKFSSQELPPTSTEDATSPIFLIQRGLSFILQGDDAKGVALFELAREQLMPSQEAISTLLDTFLRGYDEYCHAQHAHQEASLHFARAHAEQRAWAATLEARLPGLLQEAYVQYCTPHGQASSTNSHISSSTDLSSTSSDFSHTPAPIDSSIEESESHKLPTLSVNCFGHFEISRADNPDQPVVLCANRNGQAILRYLISQPGHRATADKLMNICWPEDAKPEALHKLRVAMSALRRSLNRGYSAQYGGGYILCKTQVYQINPAVTVRTDVDEFLALYQAGRKARGHEIIEQFEAACNLYTGPFLSEDLYADWSFIQRTQLSAIHLIMCKVLSDHYLQIGCYEEAIKWATKILKDNCSDEYAHRQMMYAYAYQGRRDEVLRQYQLCERFLREELGLSPALETEELQRKVFNGEFPGRTL